MTISIHNQKTALSCFDPNRDNWITNFPDKILLHIFSLLPSKEDVSNVSLTCRKWNHITDIFLGREIRPFLRECFRIPKISNRISNWNDQKGYSPDRKVFLTSFEKNGNTHVCEFDLTKENNSRELCFFRNPRTCNLQFCGNGKYYIYSQFGEVQARILPYDLDGVYISSLDIGATTLWRFCHYAQAGTKTAISGLQKSDGRYHVLIYDFSDIEDTTYYFSEEERDLFFDLDLSDIDIGFPKLKADILLPGFGEPTLTEDYVFIKNQLGVACYSLDASQTIPKIWTAPFLDKFQLTPLSGNRVLAFTNYTADIISSEQDESLSATLLRSTKESVIHNSIASTHYIALHLRSSESTNAKQETWIELYSTEKKLLHTFTYSGDFDKGRGIHIQLIDSHNLLVVARVERPQEMQEGKTGKIFPRQITFDVYNALLGVLVYRHTYQGLEGGSTDQCSIQIRLEGKDGPNSCFFMVNDLNTTDIDYWDWSPVIYNENDHATPSFPASM